MFSVKNHEKTRSGTKSGSDGARKGERKTMPPRGRENSLPARRRVRSTKKGEPPLLFFEFSGITRYLLLFPQCGHGNDGIILPNLQTVSSSETEDSLPRIPHRAVRQPCSPFPMRFCDPPHYSRMRSHTVPDPSLFSCSALYLPKPR